MAADALSKVQGSEILYMAISLVSSDMVGKLMCSYLLDNNLVTIIEELQDLSTFESFIHQGRFA